MSGPSSRNDGLGAEGRPSSEGRDKPIHRSTRSETKVYPKTQAEAASPHFGFYFGGGRQVLAPAFPPALTLMLNNAACAPPTARGTACSVEMPRSCRPAAQLSIKVTAGSGEQKSKGAAPRTHSYLLWDLEEPGCIQGPGRCKIFLSSKGVGGRDGKGWDWQALFSPLRAQRLLLRVTRCDGRGQPFAGGGGEDGQPSVIAEGFSTVM